MLINRLARIIDRTRVLEDRLLVADNDRYTQELSEMYQRSHLINYAITCSTACGLLICLVIAMLFVGDTLNLKLDRYIALFFVVAMLALISSFVLFLREIRIAARHMRVRHLNSLPNRN